MPTRNPVDPVAEARLVEDIIDRTDNLIKSGAIGNGVSRAQQNAIIKDCLSERPLRYHASSRNPSYTVKDVRSLLADVVCNHQESETAYKNADGALQTLFEKGSDCITEAFFQNLAMQDTTLEHERTSKERAQGKKRRAGSKLEPSTKQEEHDQSEGEAGNDDNESVAQPSKAGKVDSQSQRTTTDPSQSSKSKGQKRSAEAEPIAQGKDGPSKSKKIKTAHDVLGATDTRIGTDSKPDQRKDGMAEVNPQSGNNEFAMGVVHIRDELKVMNDSHPNTSPAEHNSAIATAAGPQVYDSIIQGSISQATESGGAPQAEQMPDKKSVSTKPTAVRQSNSSDDQAAAQALISMSGAGAGVGLNDSTTQNVSLGNNLSTIPLNAEVARQPSTSSSRQLGMNAISQRVSQTSATLFSGQRDYSRGEVVLQPGRNLAQLYTETLQAKVWKQNVVALQSQASFTHQSLFEALVWTFLRTNIFKTTDVPWEAPHKILNHPGAVFIRATLQEQNVNFDCVARRSSLAQLQDEHFRRNILKSDTNHLALNLRLILAEHLHQVPLEHLGQDWSKTLIENLQRVCQQALLLHGSLKASSARYQWVSLAEERQLRESRGFRLGQNRLLDVEASPLLFEVKAEGRRVISACVPAARVVLENGTEDLNTRAVAETGVDGHDQLDGIQAEPAPLSKKAGKQKAQVNYTGEEMAFPWDKFEEVAPGSSELRRRVIIDQEGETTDKD